MFVEHVLNIQRTLISNVIKVGFPTTQKVLLGDSQEKSPNFIQNKNVV